MSTITATSGPVGLNGEHSQARRTARSRRSRRTLHLEVVPAGAAQFEEGELAPLAGGIRFPSGTPECKLRVRPGRRARRDALLRLAGGARVGSAARAASAARRDPSARLLLPSSLSPLRPRRDLLDFEVWPPSMMTVWPCDRGRRVRGEEQNRNVRNVLGLSRNGRLGSSSGTPARAPGCAQRAPRSACRRRLAPHRRRGCLGSQDPSPGEPLNVRLQPWSRCRSCGSPPRTTR